MTMFIVLIIEEWKSGIEDVEYTPDLLKTFWWIK